MLKSGNYIVGSIHKETGVISFSDHPATHKDIVTAKTEAGRLAVKFTERKFVVVKIEAIASYNSVVWE